MKIWSLSIALGAAALIGTHAFATSFTTYLDETTFNSATQTGASYDFSGLVSANGAISVGSSVTVGPAVFTAPGSSLYAIGANAGYGFYGVPFLSGSVPAHMTITLDATALGFKYGTYIGAPFDDYPLDITVFQGLNPIASFNTTMPDANTAAFFGIIGDPFTSVSFSSPSGTALTFDMLAFRSATSPPLPGKVELSPSGNEMIAKFIPPPGLSLQQTAQVMGFDHFNWVQTVTAFPGGVIRRDCLCLQLAPFTDPVPGGQGHQPADRLPFYWDEGSDPNLDPDLLLKSNIFGNSLYFSDIPGSFVATHLDPMKFTTSLVGVYSDNTWVPLSTFFWSSDYNPILGGGVSRDITPSSGGSGGIFDVSEALSPTSVPLGIQLLWQSEGARISVPLPSSLYLFATGLAALGWSARRRRKQTATYE